MDATERRARATEEATQWWARLGTQAPAEVSEAERQEFTQWLRESPLHVAELLHVAHVHDALERFKLWREIPLQADFGGDNVSRLPDPGKLGERIRKNARRRRFALAASAAVLAISVGWIAVRFNATTFTTDRAERREVVLTDGSVVNLEPETTLRVDFGKSQRNVSMGRGRALFHVAKDPSRPFTVHAGNTNVRAVGTVFGVEERNQSIIVTVSEGKVAVLPATEVPSSSSSNPAFTGKTGPRTASPAGGHQVGTSPTATPATRTTADHEGALLLTANEQVTVQQSGTADPVEKVDSARALAWSEGFLVFDSTPLSEVAAEFNRYNRIQLHIDADELGHRTISGVFKASDPETLIDFIAAGAHVTVTHRGNEEIVISPGP